MARRLRLAPPPPPTVAAPHLAELAEELLDRRLMAHRYPSPLGDYALKRCAAELADQAHPDALTVVCPEGWSGWGLVILPGGGS